MNDRHVFRLQTSHTGENCTAIENFILESLLVLLYLYFVLLSPFCANKRVQYVTLIYRMRLKACHNDDKS